MRASRQGLYAHVAFSEALRGRGRDFARAVAEAVLEAVRIPVSIFQYPLASGCGFSTEALVEVARLPGVRDAVVLKREQAGEAVLTAYVVPDGAAR